MSRLTNSIREEMARKLVAYRYTNDAKELVQLNRKLADRAYAYLYSKEVLAAMAVVNKHFPDAFTVTSDYRGMPVNAGGYRVNIGGNLHSRWVRIEQAKHDGYKIAGRYTEHGITDEALSEEIKNFATRYRQFDDLCAAAYSEAMAVLSTCSTGKKLAAAWPEAMPVIGDLIPEADRTLPTVQVADVNAKFGLPPESKAE
jgi:hypothetical protein